MSLHVVPVGDLCRRVRVWTKRCSGGKQDGTIRWMVAHRSLDGREQAEEQARVEQPHP